MTLTPPADLPYPLAASSASTPGKPPRILSVDATRALVMLAMIYVNDLNGDVSPWWMKHYSETGFGPNGMTFVDLVFPSFVFLAGMSIPLALVNRLSRGVPVWKLAGHVLLRTLSLLAIGIMMVNTEESATTALMRISKLWWEGLMFLGAILAFCQIGRPGGGRGARIATIVLRSIGMIGLLYLALIYRWGNGQHLLSLRPLYLHHSWYGILGLIAWAYLAAAIVFALFRLRRLPILTCLVLFYVAFALNQNGAFDHIGWLQSLGVGEMLGTHQAIACSGLLLGTILFAADVATPRSQLRFAAWFVVGFAAAALVVAPPLPMFRAHPPLWGISKNAATPAWGLWSAAAAAAVWMIFHLLGDVWGLRWLVKPWAIAGQNVLLAYLLSEGLGSWMQWIYVGSWRMSQWYENLGGPDLTHAMGRSIGCGVVLLALTALLNRIGFSVRL
jgi:heparan-alpha-glucosaminide N-acetyltransferase